MLGFKPEQLAMPPPECIQICDCHKDINPNDYTCCRDTELANGDMLCEDMNSSTVENTNIAEDGTADEVTDITDETVNGYFERNEQDECVIDLDTAYIILTSEENNHYLATPPDSFQPTSILNEMKVTDPQTEIEQKKNDIIDEALNSQCTDIYLKIIWSSCCKILIENALMENMTSHVTSKHWTETTRLFYLHITSCPSFLMNLKLFFGLPQLTYIHTLLGSQIYEEVYKCVVSFAAQKARDLEVGQPVHFNVRNMPQEGVSGHIHIGGWAVEKVLAHERNVQPC